MSTSENVHEISTGNGDYYMVNISLDYIYLYDSIPCLLIDDILCTINLNKILSSKYILALKSTDHKPTYPIIIYYDCNVYYIERDFL